MNESDQAGTEQFPGFRLRDGRMVELRPARADDASSVAAAMHTASPATLRNRFLVALRDLPESELRHRLTVSSPDECCLVAVLPEAGRERVIGGARFVRLGTSADAGIAVTVHDEFQKQGLGTVLLRSMIPVARRHGIQRFIGEALNENQAVLSLLSRLGPVRVARLEPGVRRLELVLAELRG